MKFKYLLILLIVSCKPALYQTSVKTSYSSSGFAYIYDESDYKNKIVSKKFDNNELLIGHNRLRTGKLVKITNPENKKNIILKINKRAKYPDFYHVLITDAVASKLELDKSIPFVEINEIKKNKSFVAEKAKTFKEEKKVSNKVPVTSVKIDNISKIKKNKNKKSKIFYVIIAEFYSHNSAVYLKERINAEMKNFSVNKLSIKKMQKNNFQLISGPYNTVNSLKNDYIILKKNGFEELEIKVNE
tara:strand:- start:364 stop:1095 length:732 start_codon:yes stop_codon:yes gene_type:complete